MPVSWSLFLKDCKPKSRGIFGSSPTTSAVTSIAPLGILPKRLILLDQPSCIISFSRKSKHSETIPVRVPELEITGYPGILANLSYIFGKKVGSLLKIVGKILKFTFWYQSMAAQSTPL